MFRFFLALIFISLFLKGKSERPDTTKIPAKWKSESVIVLEHVYRAIEAVSDEARFKVTNKIIYYIRDKSGLQDLSTFNIPTYIVPGAEMQIGKIYKKNNEVIELTTRHLIPMHLKVDVGNRRKKRSQWHGDSGQKLAIPNLEVGDILEINYISNVKDFINYVYLNVRYNTIKSEIHYEVNKTNGSYECEMHFKVFNFPFEKVEATPLRLTVEREYVEKSKEETLSDDNYVYPYIIIWKHCFFPLAAYQAKSEKVDKKKKFVDLDEEEAKLLQTDQTSFYFFRPFIDTAEAATTSIIKNVLEKKYKTICDTLNYLNDLFYLCRELRGLNSLNDERYFVSEDVIEDRFFLNVYASVLGNANIPFEFFVTQYDYYGKIECSNDLMFPRYGVYVPSQKYFLFNPFLCPFANKIPYNLEGQTYYSYRDYIKFYKGKKKNKKFKYSKGTFPESTVEENFYHSSMRVENIIPEKNAADYKFSASYGGKNKESYCRKVCSNSLLYEKEINPYRKILMDVSSHVKPLEFSSTDHDRRLRKFMTTQLEDDGIDMGKLKSYDIEEPNFFVASEPTKLWMDFECDNAFITQGNYLIFDMKKLLGSQLFYKEREDERLNDFYTSNKKEYFYKVLILIPKGYKVVSPESLIKSVRTEAGKVEVNASVAEGKLEITLKKLYFFRSLPKNKSAEVVKFLNAASDFYNGKLLLVKA